jgi:hypothetical protein
MADIVSEGEALREVYVQAQCCGERARYLRHFKCVGKAAAEVVTRRIAGESSEYLRFAG